MKSRCRSFEITGDGRRPGHSYRRVLNCWLSRINQWLWQVLRLSEEGGRHLEAFLNKTGIPCFVNGMARGEIAWDQFFFP